MTDSEDSCSSSEDENILKIEKKYVNEAVAMIFDVEEEDKFPFPFILSKGSKTIRECYLPGLKDLGLCPVTERSTAILLNELRNCLAKHDFKNATKCLSFMLDKSSDLLPVAWKACYVILLNHSNSNKEILEDFLQMCVGLRHTHQMQVFLEELLTLPQDLEPISKSRKTKK